MTVSTDTRGQMLMLVLIAQFAAPLGMFGLGSLAPFIRLGLQTTPEQFGYLQSVCGLGALVSCIPVGLLADRIGVRMLLSSLQLISGAALMAFALNATYEMLLLGMFLVGASFGATMVLTSKALADWFPKEQRASVMGAKFFAQSCAGIAAGFVLPPLALWFGLREALVTVGGLSVASGMGVLVVYRDRQELRRPTAAALHEAYVYLLRNRRFRRLTATGFFFGGWLFAFTAYLTLYLIDRLGYSPLLAGGLLSLAHGAASASRIPYGWVSDHWLAGERAPMLRSLAILGIAALLALVLLPADMPVPVFAAVVLLYGASALAWGVLYQTLATELAGPNIQGLGSGVATTLVQAGSSVIPFVFGLLVSATGSYTPSWILLMLLLAGAAVLLGSGFNRADTADEEVPNPYMPPRRGTRDTSLYNLILPYRL